MNSTPKNDNSEDQHSTMAESHDDDAWNNNGGYTPLFNLNPANNTFSAGPTQDSDSDDDDAFDFESIANLALATLDADYEATLRGTTHQPVEPDEDYGNIIADAYDHPINEEWTATFGDAAPTKKNIDMKSVKSAIATIQTKSNMTDKLKRWETFLKHDIIPKATLRAFRSASHLSRAATMADALVRLQIRPRVVHIVGVDQVECASVPRLRQLFDEFLQWHACQLHLVGRDLPTSMQHVYDGVQCHAGVYHEWLQSHDVPDVAIAFNAGIWGYAEWETTLRYLFATERRGQFPFVVTAYTLQEAQDDQEVIADVCGSETSERLLWAAQRNPFGSCQVRDLQQQASTKNYKENAAWQAWMVGNKPSS